MSNLHYSTPRKLDISSEDLIDLLTSGRGWSIVIAHNSENAILSRTDEFGKLREYSVVMNHVEFAVRVGLAMMHIENSS